MRKLARTEADNQTRERTVTHHSKKRDLTLEISSKTELLTEVRKFVTDAAKGFGFPDDDISNIELAVDEACTNIIKHAYRYRPDGKIRITISLSRTNDRLKKFVIRILDHGVAFDSSKYTVPDMQEYFKRLKPGGLGIVLMRKLMDEVEYDIQPGISNSIQLVKYLAR
jgi:serine/threonine-protein kinase RsbW